MKRFEYIDVSSADAAVKALPSDAGMDRYMRSTMLKAGGIDLLDQMKERMIEPDQLINLKAAEEELRYIRTDGEVIRNAGDIHRATISTDAFAWFFT